MDISYWSRKRRWNKNKTGICEFRFQIKVCPIHYKNCWGKQTDRRVYYLLEISRVSVSPEFLLCRSIQRFPLQLLMSLPFTHPLHSPINHSLPILQTTNCPFSTPPISIFFHCFYFLPSSFSFHALRWSTDPGTSFNLIPFLACNHNQDVYNKRLVGVIIMKA